MENMPIEFSTVKNLFCKEKDYTSFTHVKHGHYSLFSLLFIKRGEKEWEKKHEEEEERKKRKKK